ncbi:hypothetical protein ACFQYP_16000 [Nonomuraea antimicrobica]
MDTRTPRILLTANTAVLLLVCVAFLLHHLDAGLLPDGMESWMARNQWLMWTAAVITVASAPAIPLLSPRLHPSADDR